MGPVPQTLDFGFAGGFWNLSPKPHLEFEAIEQAAGVNSFVLTPKQWVERTNAIGIITKAGRYAQTLAHQDIARDDATLSQLIVLVNLESMNRRQTECNLMLAS